MTPQEIRDKLLKDRQDKDTYTDGVLDFYNELKKEEQWINVNERNSKVL